MSPTISPDVGDMSQVSTECPPAVSAEVELSGNGRVAVLTLRTTSLQALRGKVGHQDGVDYFALSIPLTARLSKQLQGVVDDYLYRHGDEDAEDQG